MKWRISDEMRLFCQRNGIPPSHYDDHVSPCLIPVNSGSSYAVPERYFTINRNSVDISQDLDIIERLRKELGDDVDIHPVTFLPGFFSVRGSIKISQTSIFKSNYVCCMDISSALAIEALDVQPGQHVLDLCCAPGTKMIQIASKLREPKESKFGGYGTVTGVDVSTHRLFTCKSMLKKNRVGKIRLFNCDGTLFSQSAPLFNEHSFSSVSRGDQCDTDQIKPFHCSKVLRYLPKSYVNDDDHGYDRVIVDAECTHDGSIAHLIKSSMAKSAQPFENYLTSERLSIIHDLQLSLLQNGFRNLKRDGVLIYSTCSLSPLQNEHIVTKFLLNNSSSAKLEMISFENDLPKTSPLIEDQFNKTCDETLKQCSDDYRKLFKSVREHSLRYYGTYCKLETDMGKQDWWISGFYLVRIRRVQDCLL